MVQSLHGRSRRGGGTGAVSELGSTAETSWVFSVPVLPRHGKSPQTHLPLLRSKIGNSGVFMGLHVRSRARETCWARGPTIGH